MEKRSFELGAQLKTALEVIKEGFPKIREVRGMGLMLGMELGSDDNPMSVETDMILEKMKDRGFLIGKTDGSFSTSDFSGDLVLSQTDGSFSLIVPVPA